MEDGIRLATVRDVSAIDRLNKQYFHERGRDWAALISAKTSVMFVLERGDRIIGFSGLLLQRWNKSARVLDVFVHPQHRRHGYGAKLVRYGLRYARQWKVRTVMAEAPSLNRVLSLYLSCDFRICGYNDRYYSNRGKEVAIFLSFDL